MGADRRRVLSLCRIIGTDRRRVLSADRIRKAEGRALLTGDPIRRADRRCIGRIGRIAEPEGRALILQCFIVDADGAGICNGRIPIGAGNISFTESRRIFTIRIVLVAVRRTLVSVCCIG